VTAHATAAEVTQELPAARIAEVEATVELPAVGSGGVREEVR
jgi:hypothetical protein